MAFFKKRKVSKKEKYEYFDPELDIEAEFKKRKENKKRDESFESIEQLQYVRTQCEQINESSRYIQEVEEEKSIVEKYLEDAETINKLPSKASALLKETARKIDHIEEKRQKYQNEPQMLTRKQVARFEKTEDEFPKALINMQNDEKYCSAVRHDMKVLEAEKLSLKEEIENCGFRRNNIKNISIIVLLGVIGVFSVFIFSGQVKNDSVMFMFMIVLFLVTIVVLFIFWLQRNTLKSMKLAEKKLARVITLLNKTKIKYVNIYNSVDYQHAKYGVRNSQELSRQYEAYLGEKQKTENFRKSTVELDDTTTALEIMLKEINLYDWEIWMSQIGALHNSREMTDVKKRLKVRIDKLSEQIEYNKDRINESKKNIMKLVKKNPSLSKEIMEIVEAYDTDAP